MTRVRAWIYDQRLTLLVGLLASIPVIVASVRTLVVGWRPQGDDALIATRALDTLTTHPQLLGMPSFGAAGITEGVIHHLGPLQSWLLAVPARVPSPSALELAVGVAGVACVIGSVVLARRRGGLPLMLAVAVAIPLMLASLPAEVSTDVWNPSAPLLPFCLLLFVSWSLACGELRLLPLAVLLASFVVQCHFTFAAPAAAALVVGIVGLARSPASPSRRWILATALVGLVCWSAPLVEQAVHRPGNLVLLARATFSDQPTLGPDAGARALVRGIGVPPWWLRSERDSLGRAVELEENPGALTVVSAVLVLTGLVVVAVLARRRRRPDVFAAAMLALALSVALALTARSAPEKAIVTTGYTLWWSSVAGMWIWLALGWGATTLLLPAPLRPGAWTRPAMAGAVALVALTGALTALAAKRVDEPYEQLRTVDERLQQEAPSGALSVEASAAGDDDFLGGDLQTGAIYALRRHGREVVAPAYGQALGAEYRDRGRHRLVARFYIDRPPPPGTRVIARMRFDKSQGPVPVALALEPPRRR